MCGFMRRHNYNKASNPPSRGGVVQHYDAKNECQEIQNLTFGLVYWPKNPNNPASTGDHI